VSARDGAENGWSTADLRLFDATCAAALGEPWEGMMSKLATAIQRGDDERARLVMSMIEAAIVLGYRAVVAERWKCSQT